MKWKKNWKETLTYNNFRLVDPTVVCVWSICYSEIGNWKFRFFSTCFFSINANRIEKKIVPAMHFYFFFIFRNLHLFSIFVASFFCSLVPSGLLFISIRIFQNIFHKTWATKPHQSKVKFKCLMLVRKYIDKAFICMCERESGRNSFLSTTQWITLLFSEWTSNWNNSWKSLCTIIKLIEWIYLREMLIWLCGVTEYI